MRFNTSDRAGLRNLCESVQSVRLKKNKLLIRSVTHALFWVMTQNIKGKVGKEKYLLLLRQYQEEMLEAYLTESSDFKDL